MSVVLHCCRMDALLLHVLIRAKVLASLNQMQTVAATTQEAAMSNCCMVLQAFKKPCHMSQQH
jgi:hypothetical protein